MRRNGRVVTKDVLEHAPAPTARVESLRNLQRIGRLKDEPPDRGEFEKLVASGKSMLPDAGNPALAPLSRSNLACDSAHFFALAAIRWCGYRPANRTIVFQALPHTLSFSVAKWRFLDDCHHKRNAALYDGSYLVDEQLIKDLIVVAKELQAAVEALGPIAASKF